MDRRSIMFLAVLSGVFLSVASAFSGGIPTKVLVRVVSKDAKVIGSGVGGRCSIVNARTRDPRHVQEGETGDTGRIMVQPRGRGKVVYGTPGAAFFLTEIGLERPTRSRSGGSPSVPQRCKKGSRRSPDPRKGYGRRGSSSNWTG
jgi:hypothetical protein